MLSKGFQMRLSSANIYQALESYIPGKESSKPLSFRGMADDGLIGDSFRDITCALLSYIQRWVTTW